MSQFCFIDDSVSGVGGTALTLEAIVELERENVDFISTSELKLSDLFKDYDLFILGNVLGFDGNSFDALMYLTENLRFVKAEFDYGYCKYRGSIPHEILGKEKCRCPWGKTGESLFSRLYDNIKINALHVFYMSEGQMNIHNQALGGISKNKKSVLSSCFSSENMLQMKELSKKTKNDKFAIIDGQGGWHTEAKGIKESIEYAIRNEMSYDLIKTKTHKDMLTLLSDYQGLIFMPIIHDTCPRVTIEARYMGLEVITNEKSQHITEKWWKQTDDRAFKFTKSRPKYFWDTIKCLR
tara:strand:- start:589 stop:1473 length:885 start_codon:yes stop_codon:yes gene_type:complete